MANAMKLLFLVLFHSLFYAAFSQNCSDKMTLLEIKKLVADPNGTLSGWNDSNPDHCSWPGVLCNSQSRVIRLKIRGNSFRGFSCSKDPEFMLHGYGIRRHCSNRNAKLLGILSPAISNLSELQVLSLPFNDLHGEIPVGFWSLRNLKVLDLEGNFIYGNLSGYDFSGLKNLRGLNLGSNKLTGSFPESLGKCRFLTHLNLAGNGISDAFPGFLGSFKMLRSLHLSFNKIVGVLPDVVGSNWSRLEHLDLSTNLISGEIPRTLGNCGRLKTLLLASNAFYGKIPTEFGRLQRLEVLDVSGNMLGGRIPRKLGKCQNLSVLVLSNHFHQCAGKSNRTRQDPLGHAGAASNYYNFFQGAIPVEVTRLPKLAIVWAPGLNLYGQLPGDWGHCKNLKMLNLADNFFKGEISGVFNQCQDLFFVNLSSNMLTGNLDQNLRVPCMTVFDVSRNFMTGSIPSFNRSVCPTLFPFCPSGPGKTSDISFAYLSFFMQKVLSENPIFSSSSVLMIHNFGHNNFTGTLPLLPLSPERSKNMEYAFMADGNKLVGTLCRNLLGKCDGLHGDLGTARENESSGNTLSYFRPMCRFSKYFKTERNSKSAVRFFKGFEDLKSIVLMDLSRNKLYGQIPDDVVEMNNLKSLRLAGNNLSGSIPSFLQRLNVLQILDLSSNSFSGAIPQGLVDLKNLSTLLLNNNELSGKIPQGLLSMASLQLCNISFNNLSGPLPAYNRVINCSSLQGNPLLPPCRDPIISDPPASPPSSNPLPRSRRSPPSSQSDDKSFDRPNTLEMATIISASSVVMILCLVIVLFLYLYSQDIAQNQETDEVANPPPPVRKEITVFNDVGTPLTYDRIVEATGNFSSTNCIGRGGSGSTYKAEVSPGTTLAVKRLTNEKCNSVAQFQAEINALKNVRHPNLITLIGYYASEEEMFIIYNYMPGGNLERFIRDRERRAFDFPILHKIALGIASALSYLHYHCSPRVLHRDIKPSNILLDADLKAYLSDFGLSRLLANSESHLTTHVAGTIGYVAPEYALNCRVSEKSDVYSYGVMMLELISERRASDVAFSTSENGFDIVKWAEQHYQKGQAQEVIYSGLWEAGPKHKLVHMLYLSVACTVDSIAHRPTMRQVVDWLRQM